MKRKLPVGKLCMCQFCGALSVSFLNNNVVSGVLPCSATADSLSLWCSGGADSRHQSLRAIERVRVGHSGSRLGSILGLGTCFLVDVKINMQ
jgi:hypothetical protein